MMNGIINLNKPKGITSAKAVYRIKKALNLKKAGHAGTLDPFASGVLLVCVNRATKISQYLSSLDKEYTGTMILGITTDTQDLEGRVLKIKTIDKKKITLEKVEEVFKKFQGNLLQKTPMYSAVKFQGKPLYSLARKGITIETPIRKIKINQLTFEEIKYDYYPSITFRVSCSKGTYIRTLCHDIGEDLGSGAFLATLNRISIGNYCINKSLNLDDFLNMSYEEQLRNILPIDKALDYLNKIILTNNPKTIKQVKNGMQFSTKDIFKTIIINNKGINENVFRIYSNKGDLIALAKNIKDNSSFLGRYKVEKVFYDS